jgi:hypothetical protein
VVQSLDRHVPSLAAARVRARERIGQQFLCHSTLLHGSYSASLAAYATVLLGVLSQTIYLLVYWVEL